MAPQIRILIGLALVLVLGGCATVEPDTEQVPPEQVEDDRPMVVWNRLMSETLPVVREAVAEEGEQFRPRGFVLSRTGGIRPVHMSLQAGTDDEERVGLIFRSIEAMTVGDEIVAFVVYAAGRGHLMGTEDEDEMLVVHLEHYSGRALLRRLSYTSDEDEVSISREDVDATAPMVFE